MPHENYSSLFMKTNDKINAPSFCSVVVLASGIVYVLLEIKILIISNLKVGAIHFGTKPSLF